MIMPSLPGEWQMSLANDNERSNMIVAVINNCETIMLLMLS